MTIPYEKIINLQGGRSEENYTFVPKELRQIPSPRVKALQQRGGWPGGNTGRYLNYKTDSPPPTKYLPPIMDSGRSEENYFYPTREEYLQDLPHTD